jgi:tRNA guanosine-2'-O-methyltransferase
LEGKIQDRDPWLYKSQWELAQKRDVLTDQNWRQLKRIAEIPFESPFRRGAAAVYCIEILMASGPTRVNIEWVQALTSFTRGNEKTVSKLYDDLAGFLLVRGEMDLFLSCTQIIDPLTYAAVFCRAFYRHSVVQEISHWKKDDFNLDYYCDIIKFAQFDSLVEKFLHTNYIRQAIHDCLEIECANMKLSLSASAVLTSYNPALGMIPIDWLKPDKSGQQTIHDLSSQAGLKSRALTLSFLSAFPETHCLSYDNQVPVDGSDIVATLLLLNKEVLPSVPANDRCCRENAITACFRYISSRLRVLKTTTNESSGILRAVESMCDAAGSEARKAMCSVVSSLMDNESANDLEQLSSTLRAMWFSLVEDRLSAGERDLHAQFIQLALSPKVVGLGVPGLEEIAQSVIEQSFARRNLVLPLTLALTGTTIGPKISRMSPRNQPMWIPRILADVHIHQQITDQAFRLEDVLAGHLDHELGLVCGEWAYDAFYMAPESAARAIAIQYLANNSWCASEVFEHIISSPEYHIFKPKKRNDDVEEQTRVQCYQVLLVCERFLETERAAGYLNANLLPALDGEPSQCVRLYIEWIVARICARDIENHARPIVLNSLRNTDLPPRLSNSFQRIGLLLSRYLAREGTKLARSFFREYVKLMLPLATSNRAGIRHFSTAMLYGVDEDVKHNAFIADILTDYKEVVSGVARVAGGAETFALYWAGERFVWDLDDLKLDLVCGGVLRRITERQLYIIPPNILEKYAEVAPRTGNEQDGSDISTPYPDLLTESQPVSELDDQRGALQTKSGAYESFANDDDEHLIKRGELIVVASLVDKVPNLGGICRLCDALGAQLLCLNDMTVVKTAQFKGVAVTAEQWMPMTEVPESTIITYMREQKRAGYSLVGLEQTDNSVELKPALQFPRKTLLLIGKEREGIPGELLAELDFCVEIKQVGVVRSMNIQTATAIVVHAYASQHC